MKLIIKTLVFAVLMTIITFVMYNVSIHYIPPMILKLGDDNIDIVILGVSIIQFTVWTSIFVAFAKLFGLEVLVDKFLKKAQ